jgi:shikimate 5-dehydrogenase
MTGPELLLFIGVSTSGSSIMRLWPKWAELLELDAEVKGHDIALGAPGEVYRAMVEDIAAQESVRGALVTTHKVGVFQHAGDLFADLDYYAQACGEVSCISKVNGALIGHAKDPITAGLAIEHMVGRDYWSETSAHALCMGAGGAGVAITLYLLELEQPPPRIVITDVNSERLDAARRAHEHIDERSEVAYERVTSPRDSDALVARLPARSLVVNATGAGKDIPGSPISPAVPLPHEGIAWDINYRGELEFLAQARAQADERRLRVEDGWRYFLHGWTEVIAEVFKIELTADRFAALAEVAERFRTTGS